MMREFSTGKQTPLGSESPENTEAILDRLEWSREGFDVYEKIKELKGPLVEVAGPTEGGYTPLVDTARLGRKLHISNLFPGLPKFFNKGPAVLYGSVDFQADATHAPIKDKSVGALFCSCLGPIHFFDQTYNYEELVRVKNWLREGLIKEAQRVLEERGVLILKRFLRRDVEFAIQNGFQIDLFFSDAVSDGEKRGYDVILEKKPRQNS